MHMDKFNLQISIKMIIFDARTKVGLEVINLYIFKILKILRC